MKDEKKLKNKKDKKIKKKIIKTKKCKNCEKAKQEVEEIKAGWQRALADYNNLKRETEEKRSEWARMSEQQILEDFIPVYDNFKKAFNVVIVEDVDSSYEALAKGENVVVDKWDNWKKGIEYIKKQFSDVLKNYDIEEIKTIGQEFDIELHEAMGEEESEEFESGKILREIDAGYKMGEKIIKVAKVIVVK